MGQLINTIAYIINLGVRLTLSTGMVFNPSYQERTHAVHDLVQIESNKYEPNYDNIKSEEWAPVFKVKGENNG